MELEPQQQLEIVFKRQESLYEVGARNFIFVNVPPTDRSPMALYMGREYADLRARILEWNVKLTEFANVFRESHPGVIVAVYDVAALFTAVLDNPTKYEFKDGVSVGNSIDCVWEDWFHPTSAMHMIIAEDMAKFLTALEGKGIKGEQH